MCVCATQLPVFMQRSLGVCPTSCCVFPGVECVRVIYSNWECVLLYFSWGCECVRVIYSNGECVLLYFLGFYGCECVHVIYSNGECVLLYKRVHVGEVSLSPSV